MRTIHLFKTCHNVFMTSGDTRQLPNVSSSWSCFSRARFAKIRVFWTRDFFSRSLCCSWTCSLLHSKSLAFSGCMTHTVMDLTLPSHLPPGQQDKRQGNSAVDWTKGEGVWRIQDPVQVICDTLNYSTIVFETMTWLTATRNFSSVSF